MINCYKYAILFLIFTGLQSCSKDDTDLQVPENYTFERNGQSTVSFDGQTTRLLMAEELISSLSDPDRSLEELLEMFRNSDPNLSPFTNDNLNDATKSIKSKIANSIDYFNSNTAESSSIKNDFENWIQAQTMEVFPSWNTLAQEGSPGQIDDGSSTRYINALGLEYNQIIAKSMIGALMLDQIVNNYLSPSLLDSNNNRSNNNNGVLVEAKTYTQMEHYWDEAYGYLFGRSLNQSQPLDDLGSADGFLNNYLSKVDNDPDFNGKALNIFNAFKKGRAAIVEGNYDERDEQVRFLRNEISEIIAIRAVYYLKKSSQLLNSSSNNQGAIFHGLSEAYGFIYSLRFTRDEASNSPIFNMEEVTELLAQLIGQNNGLWNVQSSTLDNLAQQIADKFDFTVAEAAE